jgi:hypothetical protein
MKGVEVKALRKRATGEMDHGRWATTQGSMALDCAISRRYTGTLE